MNTVNVLQVKERPDVGVYIKDLSGYVVNNADDMDRIMTLGHKNRKCIFSTSYKDYVDLILSAFSYTLH